MYLKDLENFYQLCSWLEEKYPFNVVFHTTGIYSFRAGPTTEQFVDTVIRPHCEKLEKECTYGISVSFVPAVDPSATNLEGVANKQRTQNLCVVTISGAMPSSLYMWFDQVDLGDTMPLHELTELLQKDLFTVTL